MAGVTIQTKDKTKTKSGRTKRPAFEAEYFAAMQAVIARFNDIPSLKDAGLMVEASLDKKEPKKYSDGTNWGTSYYEEWGDINLSLAKGKEFVALASYRAQTVDGQRELSTNTHIAKSVNYVKAGFKTPELFEQLLRQLSGSIRTAIADGFKLTPSKIKKVEVDLDRLCAKLTAEQIQQQAIEKAAKDLERVFKDLRRAAPKYALQKIITGPLADYAFGPKAPWSNMERRLVDTMPANIGACVMCVYLDGPAQEAWILVGERPDPKNPGQFLYNGSGGGFANLKLDNKARAKLAEIGIHTDQPCEQPRETAVREFTEENRTPENKPISLLDPKDLRMIESDEGIDDSAMAKGGFPTAYSMFYTVLNDAQAAAAKTHAAGMNDDAYRAACAKCTGNETSRVRVMRLAEAAKLPMESFAYKHEAKAIRMLQSLQQSGKLVP